MNKLLFCGSYMPDELIGGFKYSSQAGNSFQAEMIAELKKTFEVEILSYIGFPIGVNNVEGLAMKFNQRGILHVIRDAYTTRLRVFLEYCRLVKRHLKGKKCVLLYNYNYLNFCIPYFAQKLGVKTILIVADYSEPQEYHNPIRKIFALKEARDHRNFDGLIFLSKELKERYAIGNSILLEGGIHVDRFFDFQPKKRCGCLRILYSGLLNEVTGIDILLRAIQLTPHNDIEFLFTGRGEFYSKIAEMQKMDARIKLLGFVPRSDYLKLLNEVHVVINPRNMALPQNDNNFPSKVLEYLASGRVIISTRFPGYEKFAKSIQFCDSTSEDIAAMIDHIRSTYDEIYQPQFLLNQALAYEYDWTAQGEKIHTFIMKVLEGDNNNA